MAQSQSEILKSLKVLKLNAGEVGKFWHLRFAADAGRVFNFRERRLNVY